MATALATARTAPFGTRFSLEHWVTGGAIVTLTLPFRECEEPATPLRAGALPGKVAAP